DVSDDRSDLRVFINPEITRREGQAVNQEGCLSIPGIYDNVERAESVTVTALDRNGSRFTLNASGLLAACIQHEMDHLQGKVFIDYLSDLKQNRIRAKPKKRQRKAAGGLPSNCASFSRALPPSRPAPLPRFTRPATTSSWSSPSPI